MLAVSFSVLGSILWTLQGQSQCAFSLEVFRRSCVLVLFACEKEYSYSLTGLCQLYSSCPLLGKYCFLHASAYLCFFFYFFHSHSASWSAFAHILVPDFHLFLLFPANCLCVYQFSLLPFPALRVLSPTGKFKLNNL